MARKGRATISRYGERVKAGICYTCGKRKVVPGKRRCQHCIDAARKKSAEKREAWREQGVCVHCGKKRQAGFVRCQKCLDTHRRHIVNVKTAIFDAYGGAWCACCGEDTREFLTVDHIDGGGLRHRRELARTRDGREGQIAGTSFYLWLKRNNFPPGYQVLCWNCNFAKGAFGICPHQRPKT